MQSLQRAYIAFVKTCYAMVGILRVSLSKSQFQSRAGSVRSPRVSGGALAPRCGAVQV